MNLGFTWLGITLIVLCSTAGDILISRAMKSIGDLHQLSAERGFWAAVAQVAKNGTLWLGVMFMGLAFFALLFALSWADVSLVAPASASLTFITNAVAARTFLHENVDRRRWTAAVLVAAGVALVSL